LKFIATSFKAIKVIKGKNGEKINKNYLKAMCIWGTFCGCL